MDHMDHAIIEESETVKQENHRESMRRLFESEGFTIEMALPYLYQ